MVAARDRAQNGPTASYAFNAAQPSTEVARWPLSDAAGGTSLADTTGDQHTATITGTATLGAPGRTVNGDTALALGGAGYASAPAPVIDTSRNFTVSAWAKLDATGNGNRAVLAADGTRASSFYLKYSSNTDRWVFQITSADVDGPAVAEARSTTAPATGVWTQLTGVYDSQAGTARLYVNGVLNGQATGAHAWPATGPFTIGRSRWQGSASAVEESLSRRAWYRYTTIWYFSWHGWRDD